MQYFPALLLLLLSPLRAEPLTYDTTPLGSIDEPLIVRTYAPDPGLDEKVFTGYANAKPARKYDPGRGRDVDGIVDTMAFLPTAIAVNHGPALSYVFDLVECRVMYAWQGGFLDFYPYWGTQEDGSRKSFEYIPPLIGNLFFLAAPYQQSPGKPKYIGYDLDASGTPNFRYQLDGRDYELKVTPSEKPLSYNIVTGAQGEKLSQTVSGEIISRHQGYNRTLEVEVADAASGERVFNANGCIVCHSLDGSRGHGPTLAGLFGSEREIEGGANPITADEGYLRESILKPNAKTAKSYPPNYMPPYKLEPKQLDALVEFLKSHGKVAE